MDNTERNAVIEAMKNPRSRMDEFGWSRMLYRYRTEAAQAAIREYSDIATGAGMS